MTLTRNLQRHAVWVFGVYLGAAFLAFWPRYLSDPGAVADPIVHVHGLVLLAWLVMLVVQGLLIRRGQRSLHRRVGRASLIVAPLVVLSILSVAHVSLSRDPAPADRHLAQLALQWGAALLFAAFYGLALTFRRDVFRHSRWMFCTVLTMTSPIFDRVLGFHVAPHSDFLPMFPDGSRTLPLIHVVLVTLLVWDLRESGRPGPFALAWGGFLAVHAFAWFAHTAAWWRDVAGWFRQLPLS